jgi:hypothetical protein
LPALVLLYGEVPSLEEIYALEQRSAPEAGAALRVRRLVDEMLTAATVLAVNTIVDRTAVTAMRSSRAGWSHGTRSTVARLAEPGSPAGALVVDAPVGQPVILDALAGGVLSEPRRTREPLRLVWDGARVTPGVGAVPAAQQLADRLRVVVEAHDGPSPTSFWPQRAALEPDNTWPVPPWTAFLEPRRVAQSAPAGFTVTAIPAGLLIRRNSAPVPENLELLAPDDTMTVVVAGWDSDPDESARATRQVLATLLNQWPVPLTLRVARDSRPLDPDEVAEEVGVGTPAGTSMRVFTQWRIDGAGNEAASAAVNWNSRRPQPLWRMANDRVWFAPPEGEQLSAHMGTWLEGLRAPRGAVLLAVPAPPDELAPERVDGWLDQLAARGQADQILILLLVGANAEQSRRLARSVQEGIDERLRRSQPAPPGLVASLRHDTNAPWRWWWPSPIDGNTATVAYGGAIPTEQEFPDLPAALAHVRIHPQAPVDVERALSDWLAGTVNEFDLYPRELARLVAESLPPRPRYEEHATRTTADFRAVNGQLVADPPNIVQVPVPAEADDTHPDRRAAEVAAVRDWLRLGVVRTWPPEHAPPVPLPDAAPVRHQGHPTVPVRFAFPEEHEQEIEFSNPLWRRYLRMLTAAFSNGAWLPAAATRPPMHTLPLPPAVEFDLPPLGQMDLWVNRYAAGYVADLINRNVRNWLEDSIPRHAADRIVVEFGSLNQHAVGGYPPRSLLWSRPDRAGGRWVTPEQYLAGLPEPASTHDGTPQSPEVRQQPIVVVLLGVTRHRSDFVKALVGREHRNVRERRVIVITPDERHAYDYQAVPPDVGSEGVWHLDGQRRMTGSLAAVLRHYAGSTPADDWVGTREDAMGDLPEISAGHQAAPPGLVAMARRWYDDQRRGNRRDPVVVSLPVTQPPEEPTSYIGQWLGEHELVALSTEVPSQPHLRIAVPARYARAFRDTSQVVIDTSALARSRATVTASAERDEFFVITPGPVAPPGSPPPTYQQPPPYQAESRSAPEPDRGVAASEQVTAAQAEVLDGLGRFAERTPPDGDSLLVSIIRAAGDDAAPSGPVAALAGMAPMDLRQHLAEMLDRIPGLIDELGPREQYRELRAELLTPGRWAHPLFDTLVEMLPRMLNVGAVTVEPDGRMTARGPAEGPTLYLVRTVDNHYLPALRRRSAGGTATPTTPASEQRRRVVEQPLDGGVLITESGSASPVLPSPRTPASQRPAIPAAQPTQVAPPTPPPAGEQDLPAPAPSADDRSGGPAVGQFAGLEAAPLGRTAQQLEPTAVAGGQPAPAEPRTQPPTQYEWLPFPNTAPAPEGVVRAARPTRRAGDELPEPTEPQLHRLRWQWLREVPLAPGPDSFFQALIATAGATITERILAAGAQLLDRSYRGRTVRQVLSDPIPGLDVQILRWFMEEQFRAEFGWPNTPNLHGQGLDPARFRTIAQGLATVGEGLIPLTRQRAAQYLQLALVLVEEEDGSLVRLHRGFGDDPPDEDPWVFLAQRGDGYIAVEPVDANRYPLPSPSHSGSDSSASTDGATPSGEATPEVVDQPLPGGVVIARADVDADRYEPLMDPGNRHTIVVDGPMDGPNAATHLGRVLTHLDSLPADERPVVVLVSGDVPGERDEMRSLLDRVIDHSRVAAVVWGGRIAPGFTVVGTLRVGEADPGQWARTVRWPLLSAGVTTEEVVLVRAATDDPRVAEAVAGVAVATRSARRGGSDGEVPTPGRTVLVWDGAGAARVDGSPSIGQWWADRRGGRGRRRAARHVVPVRAGGGWPSAG